MKFLLLLPMFVVVVERLFRELVLRQPTYHNWIFYALRYNEPEGTTFRVTRGIYAGVVGLKFASSSLPWWPGMVWLAVEECDGRVAVICTRRSWMEVERLDHHQLDDDELDDDELDEARRPCPLRGSTLVSPHLPNEEMKP